MIKVKTMLYGCAVLLLSQWLPVGGEGNMTHPCLADSPCLCTAKMERYYADCSFQNLTVVPPLPSNITDLNFNSNEIVELKDGHFSNLYRLRVLLLSNNSIRSISILAFDGLSSLEVLDLTSNKLTMTKTVYKPATFKPLVNVTTLLLAGNVATDDPANSLEYPDEALGQLHALKMLSIDGLPNKTFGAGFKQAKINVLTMSGFVSSCHIVSLFNDTFSNLPGLTHLNLSRCHIEYIQAGTFAPLKFLENLDLSYNTHLGFRPLRHVFYGLQFTNATVLNVSNLYGTFGIGTELTIQDLEFLKNTKLQEIYANSNRIELIETNALMLFPNTVQIISVEDNKFTYGDYLQQLGCVVNVEVVYANRQHFQHNPLLDAEGDSDSSTRMIDIPFTSDVDSDEESLQEHFRKKASANCHYLNGSHPLYITLPLNLKIVEFNESAMKYALMGGKMPQNNIENIDLSGNILNPWIGPIYNSQHVKELDLSENYCSQVDDQFFSLTTRLQTLKLQRNFLGFSFERNDASKIFQKLASLKSLDLSLNKIKFLPKRIFSSLQMLESLNLSLNSLPSLDIDISELNHLSNVDLQDNQLIYLPKSFITELRNVARQKTVTVNLLGNPLECTCEHLDFVQWLASSSVVFPNKSNYTCFDRDGQPVNMSRLSDFVLKLEMYCPSYVWLIILSTLCISLFLSVVLSGIVYRYRWNLRYLYYMTKKRINGFEVIPTVVHVDNYRYRAFVSYAEEQLLFIRNEMIVHLEKELEVPLCIHQRDFMAGNAVADNITHAIQSSRKTVVLLTNDFLQSYWCKFELNMARMESIYSRDGRPIILVIILERDLDLTTLPLELLELIHNNSYLEYPDDPQGNTIFWQRVKEAIMS